MGHISSNLFFLILSKENKDLQNQTFHCSYCIALKRFKDLAVPIFATWRQGNTAYYIDVEAVMSRLQCYVRFSRSGI